MDWHNYQIKAAYTAVYPANVKRLYPALGLAGEVGELCNVVKKLYRDKDGEWTLDFVDSLVPELGDILWYISACCTDSGYKLGHTAELADKCKIDGINQPAVLHQLMYLADKAGQVCRNSSVAEGSISELLLAFTLKSWLELCSGLGLNVQSIAVYNLGKLAKRKEAGTIHGSGDNR